MRFASLGTLLRDSGLVLVGRYGQFVVAIVSMPILARTLGVEGFGEYTLATAGGFFGSLLVDLGLSGPLASELSRGSLRRSTRTTFAILRLAAILTLGALATLLLAIGAGGASLLVAGMLMGGLSSVGEDWVLIGSSRYFALASSQVAARLSALAGLFLILPFFPSVWTAIVILATGNVVGAGATWIVTGHSVAFHAPTWREARALLRLSGPLLGSRGLAIASNQGPILGFAMLAPPQTFGVFAASDKVTRAAQSSLDALSVALIPRLGRAAGESSGRLVSRGGRAILLAATLGFVAAGALALGAPLVVPILLGPDFGDVVNVLRVQAIAVPAAAITSVCLGAVLVTHRDYRGMLIVSIIGVSALPLGLWIGTIVEGAVPLAVGALVVDWALAISALARVRVIVSRERRASRRAAELDM